MDKNFKRLSFFNVEDNENNIEVTLNTIKNSSIGKEIIKKYQLNEKQIEENADILLEYILSKNHCLNCQGIDFCQTNPHLTKIDVQLINEQIEKKYIPCEKQLELIKIESSFKYADFPYNWFLNKISDLNESRPRKLLLQKYINYLKGDKTWLYIQGAEDTGKSFSVATICIDATKRGKKPICYIDSKDAFNTLANLYFKNRNVYYDELYELCASQILVLDNFGEEEKTSIVREHVLKRIVDYRKENDLLTIFISNRDLQTIKDDYSTSLSAEKSSQNIFKSIAKKCSLINFGEIKIYQ